jgi:DNA polymerase
MILADLENNIKSCTLCNLNSKKVIAKGNAKSNILLCGMAPAKTELKVGKPFVGSAGKFLDLLLAEAGLTLKDLYVTNILKCYLKPGNTIKAKHADLCSRYLIKQIDTINPKIIVAMGKDTVATIFKIYNIDSGDTLTSMAGKFFKHDNLTILPTYHPQYLARFGGVNSKYYTQAIAHFKLAKQIAKGDTNEKRTSTIC